MAEPATPPAAPAAPAGRPTRDAILAAIETAPAAPAKPAEPAAAAPVDPEAVAPAAGEPDGDAAEPDAPDAEPADETDPETAKRLETAQRNEKRSRDQLEKQRIDMQAECEAKYAAARQQLEAHVKKLTEYNEAVAEAKRNPARLLRALGYTDADFAFAAEQLFAHSDKAGEDPKWRARAEQARKDRAEQERLDSLQKRLDAIDDEKKQTAQQAELAREAATYIESMAKAVPAGTAVHALMTAGDTDEERAESGAFVRENLARVAMELLERDSAKPEPKAVVAELERRENLERKRRGLPPIAKAVAKPAAPAAKPAPAKPAAKADPKAPAPAMGKRPTREEILASMPD